VTSKIDTHWHSFNEHDLRYDPSVGRYLVKAKFNYASSELASVMEFGFYILLPVGLVLRTVSSAVLSCSAARLIEIQNYDSNIISLVM